MLCAHQRTTCGDHLAPSILLVPGTVRSAGSAKPSLWTKMHSVYFVVLEIKSRVLCVLGKHSTTEPHTPRYDMSFEQLRD